MTGEPVFVKVLLEPSTKQLAAEGENGKQLEGKRLRVMKGETEGAQ